MTAPEPGPTPRRLSEIVRKARQSHGAPVRGHDCPALRRLPFVQETEKRNRAREVLALPEPELAGSVQVLQEFYWQATRRSRPGRLSEEEALAFLEPILMFHIEPLTPDLFRVAVAISRRFRLAYWDGAILAAAHACGCDAVYSEDMSDEQDYDGVRVIDPFRAASR